MDSSSRSATRKQPAENVNALAGENFSFCTIPGTRYDHVELLLGNALRRSCDAVYKLVAPCDPTLSTMAGKLASKIAADLEYRLSMAAQRRGHCNDSRDQGHNIDDLDAWAAGILEWTGFPAPTASVDSQYSDDSDISEYSGDSKYSNNSDLMVCEANNIAPSFEAFVLFVAHHIKAYTGKERVIGLLELEDRRLIMPVAKKDIMVKHADFDSADYVDSTGFVHVECGMFPSTAVLKGRRRLHPI
ncbi:hypothetical protein GGI17_006149 [Coemansia sp. S146]|nr:hypothetical protein GGI17_006149 [Coemansia sp. S146]